MDTLSEEALKTYMTVRAVIAREIYRREKAAGDPDGVLARKAEKARQWYLRNHEKALEYQRAYRANMTAEQRKARNEKARVRRARSNDTI